MLFSLGGVLLYEGHRKCAENQRAAGDNHHHVLWSKLIGRADGRENPSAEQRAHNLRYADRAVEQPEIGADIAAAQ